MREPFVKFVLYVQDMDIGVGIFKNCVKSANQTPAAVNHVSELQKILCKKPLDGIDFTDEVSSFYDKVLEGTALNSKDNYINLLNDLEVDPNYADFLSICNYFFVNIIW